MIKRIIGGSLISLPFIGILLLPLYTDVSWGEVFVAYGIAVGVIGIIISGVYLLTRD